jgi:hypothetical protein
MGVTRCLEIKKAFTKKTLSQLRESFFYIKKLVCGKFNIYTFVCATIKEMELLSGKHSLQITKVTKPLMHISKLNFAPTVVENMGNLGRTGVLTLN